PPAHVVFILATTEPHKIPLTIISRCQRFDFKSINNKVIASRMEEIMSEEQIDITTEALDAIALAAEGGMRDALSILDKLFPTVTRRLKWMMCLLSREVFPKTY